MSVQDSRPVLTVLHLSTADTRRLRAYGFGFEQTRSWQPEMMSDQALVQLIHPELAHTNLQVEHLIVEIAPSVQDPIDYFATFFADALQSRELPADAEEPVLLAVNLMPYNFPRSTGDKLVQGLLRAVSSYDLDWRLSLSLMVRLSDTLTRSASFHDAVTSPALAMRMDFQVLDYTRGTKTRYPEGKSLIPRERFERLLRIQRERFQRELVFGTNSHIGHFMLPHSHSRTHYDLSDLVAEDFAAEHLYQRIADLVNPFDKVFICAVGMQTRALELLAQGQVRHNASVCGATNGVQDIDRRLKDLREADCVLVLTDVVHTGKTVSEAIASLKARTREDAQVKCFAVARMENSPDLLDGQAYTCAVTIPRPFYPVDEPCPLCVLKQPGTAIQAMEDFHVVHEVQLTPLDFWEMVKDCDAFRRGELEPTGRMLNFRVETNRIVRRYGAWLKNVVRSRHDESLRTDRPITALLAVDEEVGADFRALVGDALEVDSEARVLVGRADLELMMLPNVEKDPEVDLSGQRVLIADDGINEGKTMRLLANYCEKHGGELAGAIVLDSRLDARAMNTLHLAMGRVQLEALYSWPGSATRLEAGCHE